MPRSARQSQSERDEWIRSESTIAAILTLAVVGSGPHHPSSINHAYGDLVQHIRRNSVNFVNPPTSDMPRG